MKAAYWPPVTALTPKKWSMRIQFAPTVEMLQRVGVLLRDVPLPEEAKQNLRQVYAARIQKLRECAQ